MSTQLLESLESIETTPLGNTRLEALLQAASPELNEYLNLALSPQITFGMKKIPEADPEVGFVIRNDKHWYSELKGLLKRLQKRSLTGNEAKTTIAGFLGGCTDTQAKWSKRVIQQDLRLNIGAKDVNKVLGDVIFQFDVPLAVDFKKANPKDLAGKFIIQPKLDGGRCVAYLEANGGDVTLYSRTGKEWTNFESVRKQLVEVNKQRRFHRNLDVVLDGEMVAYVDDQISFQAIQHNMSEKGGIETGKLKYLIFDCALRSDWESKAQVPYKTRFQNAQAFVRDSVEDTPLTVFKLGVVDGFQVENPTMESLEGYCTQFSLQGYEGAMCRSADTGIELKRSKRLLKVKTFLDAEAEVIGVQFGTGKHAGKAGALICKTPEGVVFELGTGFSDEQRRKFLKEKDKIIGLYATYKYKTLTEDRVPFHTSFKGFRNEDDFLEKSK